MNTKNLYVAAAAVSLALSVAVYFGIGVEANQANGTYIGLWVSAILSLGALISKK